MCNLSWTPHSNLEEEERLLWQINNNTMLYMISFATETPIKTCNMSLAWEPPYNIMIYLIIRRCARTGALIPGAFCVPNSVALASLTLQVVNWAIH